MSVIPGNSLLIAVLAGAAGSFATLAGLKLIDGNEQSDIEQTVLPVSEVVDDQLSTELTRMQAALESATSERGQLATSLREMNLRLNDLSDQLAANEELNSDAAEPAYYQASSLGSVDEAFGFPSRSDQDQLDDLVAAGVDPSTALSIEQRQNRYQLARLDLVDQASREGWIDSDEFDKRMEALQNSQVNIREELGDDVYDRYLYEQGGSNRVGIESVIGGSAADIAGFQQGDTVVSYANGRVFKLPELQEATRGGARGEFVQVTINRNGELIALDVPRGPLGVTLKRLRRDPG